MDADLAVAVLNECYASLSSSTCNKRQVAAALFLAEGTKYLEANRSGSHPCSLKGADYCIREEGVGDLEYLTCPSPCAEGRMVAMALFAKKETKGSTMVSTDFPCRRCRSIIIDYGVKELFFAEYHDKEPRLRDIYFADQMVANGVSVNRIVKVQTQEGKLEQRIFPHRGNRSSLAQMGMRTSGEYYMRLILDPGFRQQELKLLLELRAQHPMPEGFKGTVMTPLL